MALIMHRRLWLLIAGTSAALALASILLTEWLALAPCHLCIFQRLMFMLLAPLALIAAFTNGWTQRVSGTLTALAAAGGAATAGFQTWLQAQPEGSVSCLGPDMGPIEHVVEWLGRLQPTLFMATGFCEDLALVILGLSLAQWALLAFLLALGLSLWLLSGAPSVVIWR
ncbi:MAG: disulfide bond formation protein B [Chromatiaceae bacterium]|nr:disulfide bond formation protein B [Chromatiaceae bacterium]